MRLPHAGQKRAQIGAGVPQLQQVGPATQPHSLHEPSAPRTASHDGHRFVAAAPPYWV